MLPLLILGGVVLGGVILKDWLFPAPKKTQTETITNAIMWISILIAVLLVGYFVLFRRHAPAAPAPAPVTVITA